jgi:hypothetical protein
MKTESGKALDNAEKRFDEYWTPELFPHWYGCHFWRWITRPFRLSLREHLRQYYVLGYLEGSDAKLIPGEEITDEAK